MSLPILDTNITTTPPAAKPFLGRTIEICLVTPDVYKAMNGLLKLGIGPWKLHTFNSVNVIEQTFRGRSANFSLLVAFAQQGSMTWEIMQPVSGDSLMAEFLERQPQGGVQHVAFDCGDLVWEDRVRLFHERGAEMEMGGVWQGKRGRCRFGFFATEESVGTTIETIEFSADWEEPEGVMVYEGMK